MSHALDERLQPLLSCIDMGIIALPLGTIPAFCPGVLPITVGSMESESSTVMQEATYSTLF